MVTIDDRYYMFCSNKYNNDREKSIYYTEEA
jgi:hypothetical protein